MAGQNRQTTTTSYKCPKCKDIGFIINEQKTAGRPCDCREVRQYESIIKSSEISEAFRDYTFGNFDALTKPDIIRDAKYMAMEYVKHFNRIRDTKNHSIVFMGEVGSGKTHLSIAIANNLMKKMVPVLYMPYRETVTLLKQVITDEISYQHEVGKYKRAQVLVIDDLYKGKITESDINIMFEIINYRYLKRLPIILSTEKKAEEILEMDEAVGSRIIEMAKGRIIEIVGESLNHRLG